MNNTTFDDNSSSEEVPKFEVIEVLGVKFNKLTVHDLLEYIVIAAKLRQKTIIGNANIRAINLAYELSWYKEFLNEKADLVFCDGVGVLLGANLLGHSTNITHRMTCPDYIEDLALACEKNNFSVFLLSGKPGVNEKAISKLKSVAPGLRIAGHHGYFEKFGSENDYVIQTINAFQPKVLYVGFGMPLQEKWIVDNLDRLDSTLIMPLGACLDFYTDTVNRGPRWMTSNGMEWLSRLFVEPQRLWNRYIIGNPLFFYRIFKQKLVTAFHFFEIRWLK